MGGLVQGLPFCVHVHRKRTSCEARSLGFPMGLTGRELAREGMFELGRLLQSGEGRVRRREPREGQVRSGPRQVRTGPRQTQGEVTERREKAWLSRPAKPAACASFPPAVAPDGVCGRRRPRHERPEVQRGGLGCRAHGLRGVANGQQKIKAHAANLNGRPGWQWAKQVKRKEKRGGGTW